MTKDVRLFVMCIYNIKTFVSSCSDVRKATFPRCEKSLRSLNKFVDTYLAGYTADWASNIRKRAPSFDLLHLCPRHRSIQISFTSMVFHFTFIFEMINFTAPSPPPPDRRKTPFLENIYPKLEKTSIGPHACYTVHFVQFLI